MGKHIHWSPILAALPGLLLPSAAIAKDPTVQLLEPSSKWNVHYADDFCRLARSFGEGRDQISLVLDRFQPSDGFRLILAGQPMGGASKRASASIRFGTALAEQKLDFFPGNLGKDVPAWIFSNNIRIRPYPAGKQGEAVLKDSWITAEERASVTSVHIGSPLSRTRVLNTGPMTDAFAAMHRCTEELLNHWGIDVERFNTLTRWPMPTEKPDSWLRSNDYPRAMLAKWQPGMVQFRLIVGLDGAPTTCHIQQSTNADGFNAAVCKALMARARFEPALDGEGKPMPSFYISSVLFRIN